MPLTVNGFAFDGNHRIIAFLDDPGLGGVHQRRADGPPQLLKVWTTPLIGAAGNSLLPRGNVGASSTTSRNVASECSRCLGG